MIVSVAKLSSIEVEVSVELTSCQTRLSSGNCFPNSYEYDIISLFILGLSKKKEII